MALECPKCGEPLLGAVNRCWKCGLDLRVPNRAVTEAANASVSEPLIVAEIADGPNVAVETQAIMPTPTAAAISSPQSEILQFGPDGSLLRRGSPFAPGAMLIPPRKFEPFLPAGAKPKPPSLQKAYASSGGAIGGLILGVFGLAIAPFTFQGAIVGFVGLGMGIWGLYSKRRGWSLAGLILCCLAIGWGCYTGAFWLFQTINNASPWEY